MDGARERRPIRRGLNGKHKLGAGGLAVSPLGFEEILKLSGL
jgi:hypothetical protein